MAPTDNDGPPAESPRRLVINVGRAINMVATFVAAVFTGFFGGYFLDRWLHTTPWLTVTLAFVGIATGVYIVWREARRFLS